MLTAFVDWISGAVGHGEAGLNALSKGGDFSLRRFQRAGNAFAAGPHLLTVKVLRPTAARATHDSNVNG